MAAKKALGGMQESLARILKRNGLDPRRVGIILFPLREGWLSSGGNDPDLDSVGRAPGGPSKPKAKAKK